MGLRDSKGSVLRLCLVRRDGCGWNGYGTTGTFFEIAEVFEFGLVGDVELVEDDGHFPWVGALWLC